MYGSKIASIRIARGYSQEYVAKKIGVKQNTLSDIEKDVRVKVDEKTLTDIAGVLGVSLEDIKSQTPIVMNFTSNDSSMGQQNNYIDSKVLEALLDQLAKKDEQIDKLIQKIG